MTARHETLPDVNADTNEGLAVVVDATVVDERSGARWIHKDLVEAVKPWELEAHIAPAKVHEQFGDVESWAAYVKAYSIRQTALMTWKSEGLRAVLDYHQAEGQPNRCQWVASQPFIRSVEWQAWTALANGHGVPQAKAVEFLEDHAPDIVDPAAADLLELLRKLRTYVNKTAETHVREDGTIAISFTGDNGLAARGGTTDLPSEFTIGIPVLKGHTDVNGQAVLYSLKVRLRATVDDQSRLALRFSIPLAERTLETVLTERVASAKELLGDGFSVLRAAD